MKRVDKHETGTVEYKNYEEVVYEILEAMDAKKVAEEKLEEQKDEEVFASVLTLINDETQDIEEALITKFRSKED